MARDPITHAVVVGNHDFDMSLASLRDDAVA
jgi:hypothetical protein